MARRPRVHNRSSYTNLGCRCVACRADHALYHTTQRRQHRAQRLASEAAGKVHVVEGIKHGTGGYGYWNCRCETCRLAHNAATNRRARDARARRRPAAAPEVADAT